MMKGEEYTQCTTFIGHYKTCIMHEQDILLYLFS